jgi:hypothetical protein
MSEYRPGWWFRNWAMLVGAGCLVAALPSGSEWWRALLAGCALGLVDYWGYRRGVGPEGLD